MSTIKVNRFENLNGMGFGTVLQTLNYNTGSVATGTTTIPYDDTIPQIAEGTEFMTLAITPKSATNKLKITVSAKFAASSANSHVVGALFQDSAANALIASAAHSGGFANSSSEITLVHYMTTGTTSTTTFKFRMGPIAAFTVTFNGSNSARLFGGICTSSITIEEIQV